MIRSELEKRPSTLYIALPFSHFTFLSFCYYYYAVAPMLFNDLWGWTSGAGREFVITGVEEGTYFVEITDGHPITLGFLPSNSALEKFTMWSDMKIIGNYAYIVADQGKNYLVRMNYERTPRLVFRLFLSTLSFSLFLSLSLSICYYCYYCYCYKVNMGYKSLI